MTSLTLAGRQISQLGYGALRLPGPNSFGPPADRSTAIAVLRRAVELGVEHIDTAQFYGPDVANELIRDALSPYGDNAPTIVTKIGGRRDSEGGWLPAQRPEELREAVELNLRTLGLDALAVVNLGAVPREAVAGTDQEVDYDDQLAVMVELVDAGKIRAVGLTNVSLERLEHAGTVLDVVCVQNAYNLIDRSDEVMVDRCLADGIPYMPYWPLGSPLTGNKVIDEPVVRQVAAELEAQPAQVAVAWLLNRGASVMPIPGTSSIEHLEENMAATSLQLTAEQTDRLSAIAASAPPTGSWADRQETAATGDLCRTTVE